MLIDQELIQSRQYFTKEVDEIILLCIEQKMKAKEISNMIFESLNIKKSLSSISYRISRVLSQLDGNLDDYDYENNRFKDSNKTTYLKRKSNECIGSKIH